MKTCNNCGAQLEADDKFCTSCGTPVTESTDVKQVEGQEEKKVSTPVVEEVEVQDEVAEVQEEIETEEVADDESEVDETDDEELEEDGDDEQPQVKKRSAEADAMNVKVEQTKIYAQNYWEWFRESIKKPFEAPEDADSRFGITTFGLSAILGGLFVILPGRQLFNEVSSREKLTSALMTNPFSFELFIKVLLVFVATYAIFIGVGYGVIKMFSSEEQDTALTSYMNRFAHFVNYTAIFSIIALILTMISVPGMVNSFISELTPDSGLMAIVGLLLIITALGFNTGFLATFFDKKLRFKIDHIYVVVIAQILVAIVVICVFRYYVIPMMQNAMSGIFGLK